MEAERLPDPIDAGSALAEQVRAGHEAAARAKAAPKQVKVPQRDPATGEIVLDANQEPVMVWPEPDCVECGAPIPEARLESTGTDLCIDCARRAEHKDKLFMR